MIKIIKENKAVITVVAVLLVLILLRSSGINHFRTDARKWAEPSLTGTNTITAAKGRSLEGSFLLISLDDKADSLFSGIKGEHQQIAAESLLERKNIKHIMNYSGKVILCSSDDAISARIWMVLSQMGRKDLYILVPDPEIVILHSNHLIF